MNNTLVAVNFNNQTLTATLVDNVPHVALKPICENLGLDWASQFSRIKRHPILSKGIVMITTPSNGGLQEMMMLPLKMLNGWLFGIDSSRVKAEIKDAVIKYQEECFDVLANHFMPKPNALRDLPRPNITGMEAAQLKKSVEAACKTNKKLYSELYRKLYSAYGIDSYMNLPAGKLNEALVFLGLKPVEMPKTVMISVEEYNALKMSKPEPKNGMLVDMPTLTLALPNDNNRIVVIRRNGLTSMFEMPENYLFGSPETLAHDLKALGYIVVKKQELIARLEA